jgi:hypothetical protein
VRKGLLQGIQPDQALLPQSTKASSSDDSTEFKTQAGMLNHLPPAYVDI